MALPVDSFLRPKRKNTIKLKLVNPSSKKKEVKGSLLFKANYFNWTIFSFSIAIICACLLLLDHHLMYVAPEPLFIVQGELVLEPLSIELRDRMGKEQSVVLATTMGHGLFYTAVLGDGVGLSSLAQRYKLSLGTLMSFNGLHSLDESKSLETIRIPLMNGLIVDVGKEKTLSWVSKHYSVDESLLRIANFMPVTATKVTGALFIPQLTMGNSKLKRMIGESLLYPVFGSLVQEFGHNRDRLTGLDHYEEGIVFQTEPHTAVYSIADGVVLESGYHARFGYYLLIKHQEYLGFYGNLSLPLSHSINDSVKQSELLGKVEPKGRYGLFHFSLIKHGLPIDPIPLLR